jgi:hypothetical protein
MRLLSEDELRRLRPADTAAFAAPMPTQIASSDEGLRRRRQHGEAPLGAAAGPIKTAILRPRR